MPQYLHLYCYKLTRVTTIVKLSAAFVLHCGKMATMVCFQQCQFDTPMVYVQQGNQGGKVLINEGYHYQRNKTKNEKIYWRCWRKTCNAFLQTGVFDLDEEEPNIHILQVVHHNQPDEMDLSLEFKETTNR